MSYIGKQLNDLPGKVTAVASGTLADGSAVIVNANGTVSVIEGAGLGSITDFGSGAVSYGFASTFDSNSNKVVITYDDGGNSGYGTAIVGTVSGSSISFGTAVVYESAAVLFQSITEYSVISKHYYHSWMVFKTIFVMLIKTDELYIQTTYSTTYFFFFH